MVLRNRAKKENKRLHMSYGSQFNSPKGWESTSPKDYIPYIPHIDLMRQKVVKPTPCDGATLQLQDHHEIRNSEIHLACSCGIETFCYLAFGVQVCIS